MLDNAQDTVQIDFLSNLTFVQGIWVQFIADGSILDDAQDMRNILISRTVSNNQFMPYTFSFFIPMYPTICKTSMQIQILFRTTYSY
jgi:hypothetical protein